MIVAFMHIVDDKKFKYTKNDHRIVPFMVESVKRTMPNVDIVHLTDEATESIPGTITYRRPFTHDNPTLFRMQQLKDLDGEVLILDTDIVVQKDMRHVFAFDFDVALTWRSDKIIDVNGVDLTKLMPYNTGVVFSRSRKFWEECVEWASDKEAGWYTDQGAVAVISHNFNVLKLHCDNFNYAPFRKDEDLSSRYAVHYKGNRKSFILGET